MHKTHWKAVSSREVVYKAALQRLDKTKRRKHHLCTLGKTYTATCDAQLLQHDTNALLLTLFELVLLPTPFCFSINCRSAHTRLCCYNQTLCTVFCCLLSANCKLFNSGLFGFLFACEAYSVLTESSCFRPWKHVTPLALLHFRHRFSFSCVLSQ